MKLTIDQYCQKFKISKEVVHTRLRDKKLSFVSEDSTIYILIPDTPLAPTKPATPTTATTQMTSTQQKPTVATVLALLQKENRFLKDKILALESKIEKLIDDKEQLLRDEKNRLENFYNTKDEQLKNILELVNKKLDYEQEFARPASGHNYIDEATLVEPTPLIELKEYLRSLDLRPHEKKIIKKRFLAVYDSDIRIIRQHNKLYLNISKYDYGDLLVC